MAINVAGVCLSSPYACAPLPPACRLPGIFMDLKGPAFSQEAVQKVAAAAEEQRILPHVALFVMGPEQEGVAVQAGYKGPLIRGYAVSDGSV